MNNTLIDEKIDYYYNAMLNDEKYYDFTKSRSSEKIKKNIKKIIQMVEKDLFLETEKAFNISQDLSLKLLSDISNYSKKNDAEKIILTIESIQRNIIGKLKKFFNGDEIDSTYSTAIKNILSDLMSEKNKYLILKLKLNEQLDLFFVLEFMINKFFIKDIENNEFHAENLFDQVLSAKFSIITTISYIETLEDKNNGVILTLINYTQNLSPKLFNELIIYYANRFNCKIEQTIPSVIKLKLESINIIKKSMSDKINEFYSIDNVAKLNKIIKSTDKQSVIYSEISEMKREMEYFQYSLIKLNDQLQVKISDIETEVEKNDLIDIDKINSIIHSAKQTSEDLMNIIIELHHKINIVYSEY